MSTFGIDADKEWRRRNNVIELDPRKDRVEGRIASAIKQQSVKWLWENRLALGKIALIGGYPGVGKSQMVIDWIARMTSGGRWPTGELAPPGNAIILSSEDDAADTICPRLEAAGAMLEGVYILGSVKCGEGKRRTFSLQRDLEMLERVLQERPHTRLLMIDPVTAYLGEIDSHRTTDVRSALSPLEEFAAAKDIAVASITHPPKGVSGNAINSFTGSLAFAAAPRLCHICVSEPDSDRKLFLAVKNNLGPLHKGHGYSVIAKNLDSGIVAPRIVWDDAPVDVTASEAIYAANQANRPESKMGSAKTFLESALADGARLKSEIEEDAKRAGISGITLRRAQIELGIVYSRKGFPAVGMWELPQR